MASSKNISDDYSSDEYSNEEGKDDVYDQPSNSNSSNEEDGNCLGMEELALLKPSTSGMAPNFYSAKLPIPNETLFGHIDQDESRDDMSYHFSSAIKRPNEDHEDYSFKRLRKEDSELDEPSTSGIRSSRSVESSSLQRNQDDYSSEESSNDECNVKKFELDEASTSGRVSNFYNVESSAPKKVLHGLTYQLRLLMLFVQRVPDEQEFYLSTEMHEAGLFDDIVLQYLGEGGVWRYRFLQVKHKNEDQYKIKMNDLFNKKTKSKIKPGTSKNAGEAKPYLLKKYFKSYCDIEQNIKFENVDLEEFLMCTNVGFDDDVKKYFECAEKSDSILFNFKEMNEKDTNLVKYRLTKKKEQLSELREEFEINDQNEKWFLNFVAKFRFLPDYGDDVLNKNIEYCLKKCFKMENVDLVEADLQKRVLEWFQSYKDKKSRYLRFKDKKEFFKSPNNNIDSLLVAGCSTFYFEELKSCEKVFKNISLLHKFFNDKKDKIMFIITTTPKLSVIKLNQLFNELELKQDEFILTDADKLRGNKKISTTFFATESYKWLLIECQQKEINLSRRVLKKISKMKNEKRVVIIGRKDHVLKFRQYLTFDTSCFYDKNNSFENLTRKSQEKILEKKVEFQGKNINLNEIIDINSGEKIIDENILEKILTKTMKMGNNDEFESDFLIEECYISRKLVRKKLRVDILQNVEVLKNCLFIISGVNRDQLKHLNINNELIFVWENGKNFENGIIISEEFESENIFWKFCKNKTKNVYWLKYIKEEFLIMNFRNGTDIFNKPVTCFEEHELNKNQILDENILIVADGPGCGKSTFLTRVARQLKQIMSNIWVLRINLSFYAYKQEGRKQVMKSLKDIQFENTETKKAAEFMAHLLFPQENESENKYFVRELFIQSLDCLNGNMKFPKIILLFDGFDEISPTFKEKTLTLLQALRNSNVAQMWITTRNHEEHSLEMALHSSSFFLRPLDDEEKVDFLEKLWKYNLVHFDDIESKPDSKDILTYLKEITNNICNCDKEYIKDSFRDFQNHLLPNLSDYEVEYLLSSVGFSYIAEHLIFYFEYHYKMSKYTENPLQIKMLAEIIFFKKFNSLDKLDIFSLYEEFIKYKFRVFRDDKDVAGKSVAGRGFFEAHLEYLTTVHQEIAFQTLFPHYDNIQFRKVKNKIELSRAGLLVIHDDRLEFVHRSFAEYLVSQYFAENFHCQDIQKIVISDVLINENYSLIRTFLNNNETFLGKLSSKTQQMKELIRINNPILLNQMLKEELYNLFMKFLEKLSVDLFKNFILFNENIEGKTGLHIIFEYIKDEQILENILKAIKESVSSETLKELFSKKDKREGTALFCINFYRKNSAAKQKLQFFKLNCTSELFYKLLLQVYITGETVLHRACSAGFDIIDLLEVSDENRDTIKDLLLKTDIRGRTALFNTIRYSDNSSLLTTLLNLIKSVCNSEEMNYLFSMKNDSINLLHCTCTKKSQYMLVIVLNAIKDNPELIKTLLLDTDEDGLSPLHYIVRYFVYFDMLKILLDFVNLNCDTETLHTILCQRTKNGKTILHMALENFEETDDLNSLTSFLTYLFSLVGNDKEIFYNLLLTTNVNGQTVLHCTFSRLKYPFLLKELLDFVQTNCSENILTELLLKLNNNKASILHCVCCQNNVGKLTFLLNKIKDNPEILNKLLLQTDSEGYTALYYALLNYENPSMMSALLNFVKLNCEEEIFKNLLCKTNNEGFNVLHFACMRIEGKTKYEDHLKSLLKFIENHDSIINELLLKTCWNGCTPLHYTVRDFDNPSLLKILFDFIKNYDSTILNILLLKESNTGCSLLHFACEHSNEESLKYLLYVMQDNIAIRDILILKPNHKGQTILHYSVDNFQMLKFFLDFVKLHCGIEIFTNLILKCDQKGRTVLHTFYKISDDKENLTYLLSLVKNNTTPEKFNLFLSKKDCHGKMASDYIACNTNSSLLLEVLSNFDIQLRKKNQ